LKQVVVNAFQFIIHLIGKPERKRHVGRHRNTCDDKVTIIIKETGCEDA